MKVEIYINKIEIPDSFIHSFIHSLTDHRPAQTIRDKVMKF